MATPEIPSLDSRLANTTRQPPGSSSSPDIQTATTPTDATDVGCGYVLAIERAVDFDGDVDQPNGMIGWSCGAVTALFASLEPDATGLRTQAEGCSLGGPG